MVRAMMYAFVGVLAVLATATALCLQVIVAVDLHDVPLRTASTGAATMEALVLAMLLCLVASRAFMTNTTPSLKFMNLTLGLELFVCALAATISALALAQLSQARGGASPAAAVDFQTQLLAAISTAVIIAAMTQPVFILIHFLTFRERVVRCAASVESAGRNLHATSVPYNQTMLGSDRATRGMTSLTRPTPPVGESTAAGAGFFSHPLTHALGHDSSETKLLPPKEQRRRPPSLDSLPRRSSTEEPSFDSWDTSSVYAHNRQIVLEMASPTTQLPGLETIPASPAGSRSPSPDTLSDLEPPRSVRTSRSYSHGTVRQRDEARLMKSGSANELHIHPLFRSGTHTPPPVMSPGTSVLAAPNAGQVISRRESMQSLARMRSSSLPAGRSPLAHQRSLENARLKTRAETPTPQSEARVGKGSDRNERDETRMMPPVPAWLLSPGLPPATAQA